MVLRKEKPILCTDCDARFSGTSSQLRVHTFKRHAKWECISVFSVRSQISVWETGEKHFKCSDCNAAFRLSWQSKHHTVVHSHVKLFSCRERCSSLKSVNSLQAHVKIVHRGLKPSSCEECGAKFSKSFNLKSRLKTHGGETRFSCTEYRVCFRLWKQLTFHTRLHTEEKQTCIIYIDI